jgi:hypothetical protein
LKKDIEMDKIRGGDTNLGLVNWRIGWRSGGGDSLRRVLESGRNYVPVGTQATFLQFGGNDIGVDNVGEIVEMYQKVVNLVLKRSEEVMVGEVFPRYETRYGTVERYGEHRNEINQELKLIYEGSPQVECVHPYRQLGRRHFRDAKLDVVRQIFLWELLFSLGLPILG